MQAISIRCESTLADSAAMEPIWTQQEPILCSHAHAQSGAATQGGGREAEELCAAKMCSTGSEQPSSSPVLDLSLQYFQGQQAALPNELHQGLPVSAIESM